MKIISRYETTEYREERIKELSKISKKELIEFICDMEAHVQEMSGTNELIEVD